MTKLPRPLQSDLLLNWDPIASSNSIGGLRHFYGLSPHCCDLLWCSRFSECHFLVALSDQICCQRIPLYTTMCWARKRLPCPNWRSRELCYCLHESTWKIVLSGLSQPHAKLEVLDPVRVLACGIRHFSLFIVWPLVRMSIRLSWDKIVQTVNGHKWKVLL